MTSCLGAPSRIRTYDLQLRRLVRECPETESGSRRHTHNIVGGIISRLRLSRLIAGRPWGEKIDTMIDTQAVAYLRADSDRADDLLRAITNASRVRGGEDVPVCRQIVFDQVDAWLTPTRVTTFVRVETTSECDFEEEFHPLYRKAGRHLYRFTADEGPSSRSFTFWERR